MRIYLTNKILPASEAKVSVSDHGFLYGDGIYETMRSYNGVVFMLDEHLMRLQRSAALIELTIGKTNKEITSAVYRTMKANALRNAYLRITVSRGYGEIGLDPALCAKPTFVIMAKKFRNYPDSFYKKGVSLIISSVRRNLKEAVNPQIKSLNFLNNILAKIEAKKKKAHEALMLNSDGYLTEGTISNIFFLSQNALCTPSVDCGILDGITRNIVLDIARKNKIKVKEGRFKKENIFNALEIFITNTSMEIMPVSGIDAIKYPVGDITRMLHDEYKEKVKSYIKTFSPAL